MAAPAGRGHEVKREHVRARLDAERDYLMLGGVLLITLLDYLRSLGNGFALDDEGMILNNHHLGEWSYLWKSFVRDLWWFRDPTHLPQTDRYRPLVDVWFGLNYHLFGLNPAFWHLTMIVVHLVAVWLVFRIAAHLTADRLKALLACALFALLPLHAQAVVWASGVSLLLGGTLQLAAFYVFITGDSKPGRLALALVLYAGALLCHESAVVFPAMAGSYVFLLASSDASPAGGIAIRSRLRRTLLATAPFVAEVALYMVVRRLVLGFFINGPSSPNGPLTLSHATLAQVLMTIPRVALTDLVAMVVPAAVGLVHRQLIVTNTHSPNFVTSLASTEFYVPVAALIVLVGGFLWLVRTHPRRPLYLFCLAWIAIAIVPMLNLAEIATDLLIQDDYLYIASAGLCLMAADWVVGFARGLTRSERNLVYAVMAGLIVVYAATLWKAQGFWHDDLALYTRCVEEFPESSTCHRTLGAELERRHDLTGAEQQLVKSLEFQPDSSKTLERLAIVHMELGRNEQAVKEAAEAVRLEPHPFPRSYILLAKLYDAVGNQSESEEALKRADALPDGEQSANVARAQIRMSHGDLRGAEAIMRKTTERYPKSLLSWIELGLALAAQKQFDGALSAFQQALRLSPSDPSVLFLTAEVLHSMGRDDEALEQCRTVLAALPDDIKTRALMQQIERAGSRR